MFTGLLSRELASDTGISIFCCRIVPGYRVFLVFFTKSPPLSAPLRFEAMRITPKINKIIIISDLQMHSYEQIFNV
jgi:hypothetical protein